MTNRNELGHHRRSGRSCLAARSGSAPTKRRERTYTKGHQVDDQQSRKLDRDVAVIRGFKRMGLKESQIELRVNVKPYKVWLAEGRQVRKGQHGVRGLFHITQTDPAKPVTLPTEADVLAFASRKAAVNTALDSEYGPQA